MKLIRRCDCARDGIEKCSHSWYVRFQHDGREHLWSTHTANRTVADRVATKRKADVLEGKDVTQRRKRVKLSAHITPYVEWSEKTNRSAALKDRRVLDQFSEFLGERRLDQVTTFDIERWKSTRAKDVQKSTVNRELNVIRGCFSRAVEWGLLSVSPVLTVKPYKVENVRTRILSTEEITRLLDGCTPDLRLIARTTLESLPRLSEVLNLRREDIGPT